MQHYCIAGHLITRCNNVAKNDAVKKKTDFDLIKIREKETKLLAATSLDSFEITGTESPAVKETLSTTMSSSRTHSETVLSHWDRVLDMIGNNRCTYAIDGKSLDMSAILAVAR